MDKQQRIDDIKKYIDKYYCHRNDDIELDDERVKSFFEKISDFLTEKKSKQSDAESDASENNHLEFDPSSDRETTISKPMSQFMAGNRKIDDLMSQMDETFSQRLLRMIRERGMSEADVYKKAYVDRRHFSKIK